MGFAVIGLGRLAIEQVIPGFAKAERACLVALVSGSPDKAKLVAVRYAIEPEAMYGYDAFDRIRDAPEVAYIVLPNAMHRAFTQRETGRSCGKELRILHPIDGIEVPEEARDRLHSWRASRPVLIGNVAANQDQHDMEAALAVGPLLPFQGHALARFRLRRPPRASA